MPVDGAARGRRSGGWDRDGRGGGRTWGDGRERDGRGEGRERDGRGGGRTWGDGRGADRTRGDGGRGEGRERDGRGGGRTWGDGRERDGRGGGRDRDGRDGARTWDGGGGRGDRRGSATRPFGGGRSDRSEGYRRRDGVPPARRTGGTRPVPPGAGSEGRRDDRADLAGRGWGSVARRGGRAVLQDAEAGHAPGREPQRLRPGARPEPYEEVWVLDDVEDAADGWDDVPVPPPSPVAGADGAPGGRQARAGTEGAVALPSDVVEELTSAVGAARGGKLGERLAAAVRAYERDRYPEALRITRVLVDEVPESGAARELHGLVCYRLGRWRDAIRHLTAAAELQGDDPSQVPVLMDCHRALGHHRRVGELWEGLRAASPDADVLVEGRLVLAADLAEQARLGEAIDLLLQAGAARDLRRPGDRHVRQWYLLADLSERAGDIPRARELFARVVASDPEMADAGERLAALGPAPRTAGGGRGAVTLAELAKAQRPPRPVRRP